jgi:hypothetical protein
LTTGRKLIRRPFTDVYFPVQSDEAKWAAISRDYRFNVIAFNYRERSVRGEQFIVRRVLDPMWAPIFLDKNILFWRERWTKSTGHRKI